VTLLAVFKCSDGFVICADSQETAGDFRVSRKKLVPERCGEWEVALAGAGHEGTLIDAFCERLYDNLKVSKVSDLDGLK
jgi:hypothetical protein